MMEMTPVPPSSTPDPQFLLLLFLKLQHPHQDIQGTNANHPQSPQLCSKHVTDKMTFEDEKGLKKKKGVLCFPGMLKVVFVGQTVSCVHQPWVQKMLLANLQSDDVKREQENPRRARSACRTCQWISGHSQGDRTMDSMVVTVVPSFVFPEALKIEGNHHVWSAWSLTEKWCTVFVLTNHLASDVKAVWRKISSSNAALGCASHNLNLLMTLKHFLLVFFIDISWMHSMKQIEEKNTS